MIRKEELITSVRRPGRDDSWTPTLLGFHKRELLREVLNIFGTWERLVDTFLCPLKVLPQPKVRR